MSIFGLVIEACVAIFVVILLLAFLYNIGELIVIEIKAKVRRRRNSRRNK